MNKKRQRENPVVNEAMEVFVLGQVAMDSILSTRKLANETGVNRTSVQRILKKTQVPPVQNSVGTRTQRRRF